MSAAITPQADPELTRAISARMVELYGTFYEHDRTTATTYINDNIVVCVLENILTEGEDTLIAEGASGEVIDGRVAFQTDSEDEFTAEIERLTHRRVVAYLSANQTKPGVACELFFLDAAPLTAHRRREERQVSRRKSPRERARNGLSPMP
jgi:uncharacterized protein YbcI